MARGSAAASGKASPASTAGLGGETSGDVPFSRCCTCACCTGVKATGDGGTDARFG